MISVIIPVYNGKDFIERAIQSVIMQTYTDWELIVIDDCSTDNTYDIIKKYESPKIHILRNEENKGVGITRKVALDTAKGEFVTFLDADDYLKPDYLNMNILLQKQQNADVVYTSFTIFYPEANKEQVIKCGEYCLSETATPQMYFNQQTKFLTGKLFRRSLCETVNWSDKRVGEDVQTLFFLMYNADVVRTTDYSGYVHIFREGSLLANADTFLCCCGSTLSETEMVEFLYKKQDKVMLKYVATNAYNNFKMIQKLIRKKQFTKESMKKYNSWWVELKKWFNDPENKEILKIIDE